MLNTIRYIAIIAIMIAAYGVYTVGANALAKANNARNAQFAAIEGAQ